MRMEGKVQVLVGNSDNGNDYVHQAYGKFGGYAGEESYEGSQGGFNHAGGGCMVEPFTEQGSYKRHEHYAPWGQYKQTCNGAYEASYGAFAAAAEFFGAQAGDDIVQYGDGHSQQCQYYKPRPCYGMGGELQQYYAYKGYGRTRNNGHYAACHAYEQA